MNESNLNIYIGLDIGTTKIAVMIGKMNLFNKVEILGVGKSESLGVSRGVVANIDKTVEAIQIAVEAAKKNAGIDFTEVVVGIAGQHIKSLQHRGALSRENAEEEITQIEVDKLTNDMRKISLPPGDTIIHVLPQEFIVDNESTNEPVGRVGHRLEGNFHIITGQNSAVNNIARCVKKAGLVVSDIILEPLASSDSVLTDEELEAGVALIDIGGGTTDIAIFYDNIIRHTSVIPLGGNIITEDIREAFGLTKKKAELLKIQCGNCFPESAKENEYITVPMLEGRNPKEISSKKLAQCIEARVQEIIDMANARIRSSGFEKKLAAGIVLTGGGAMLKNIKILTEKSTGIETRLGYPTAKLNSTPKNIKDISHPGNATGIGLVISGYKESVKQTRKAEGITSTQSTSINKNIIPEKKDENQEDIQNQPLEEYNSKKENKFTKWWEKAIDSATEWIKNGSQQDPDLK